MNTPLKMSLACFGFVAAVLLGQLIGNTYADHHFGDFRRRVERNRIDLERFQAERAEEIRRTGEQEMFDYRKDWIREVEHAEAIANG